MDKNSDDGFVKAQPETDDFRPGAACYVRELPRVALNLARNRGYRTVPGLSKRPLVSISQATLDPDAIAAMWRRCPNANTIQLVTGEASQVDVLDADTARHPEAAAWLEAARPHLPATRIYATPSGGLHVYFQHAAGLRCSTSKLANGIDIKADGGCCSFWFAAGLECLDHTPVAPWPDWLLKIMLWRPPERDLPATNVSPDCTIRAVIRVAAEAKPGNRNHALHWSACRVAEQIAAGHIDRATAESALLSAALQAGLTREEARPTIRSGMRETRHG